MAFKDYNQLTQELKSKGYKYLNWANGWGKNEPPEHLKCNELNHNSWQSPDTRANIQHDARGYRNTVYCDTCKIYWNYDCSD